MKKRVAIIFGGNSVEHEISILSWIQAYHAINKDKYEVLEVYMTKDGHFWVGPDFSKLTTFQKSNFKHYEITFYNHKNKLRVKGITKFLPLKYRKDIDVVLPIVHGKNVEDGSLAGYFNILNVAFASSEVLTAAIFQNKYIAKQLLDLNKINVVPYYYFNLNDYKKDVFAVLENCLGLGFPMIIKPVSLGSSVGIKIAKNQDELIEALNYCSKYDDEIIVEKKLEHYQEFNQAVLEKEDYVLSNIEEVKTSNSFLTFTDKYMNETSSREIPANIDESLADEISYNSQRIATIFNPRGVIRIDYLYDTNEKILYVNEINSIPGSLSFYLYEDKISYSELIDLLINQAIKNKYIKDQKLNSFKTNVLSNAKILKK